MVNQIKSFSDIYSLREKCLNTELFLVHISCIWTEYSKIRTRNNSVFGKFSRSATVARNPSLFIWKSSNNSYFLSLKIAALPASSFWIREARCKVLDSRSWFLTKLHKTEVYSELFEMERFQFLLQNDLLFRKWLTLYQNFLHVFFTRKPSFARALILETKCYELGWDFFKKVFSLTFIFFNSLFN